MNTPPLTAYTVKVGVSSFLPLFLRYFHPTVHVKKRESCIVSKAITQTNGEVISLDTMDLVTYIRETEEKLEHIHRAIDELSLKHEMVESVTVLQVVAKEYKIRMEKAKDILSEFTIED